MSYMTPEEQAALEAEQAEAKAKADADAKDDDTSEGKDEPDEESKQFKAELLKERSAREKAEKASAEYAFKLREKKRKGEDVEEEVIEEDEDKPLTSKELQKLLARERETTRKEIFSKETDRLAANMSTNDTERQLILEIHKNRSFPEHLSLEEQIEECYVIANKKKLMGENSELKRALRGKQTASKDVASTHQDAPTGSQPKLAAGEAAELARVGFIYNATARRYEKKLPGNQLLVKTSKTSGTQLVKA